MEITDEKNLKRYTVGLCPWSSSDFAEILREEDFDVVELEEFFDEGQFPDFLDAVVIDLSGEESVGLEKRVARELPNTPRILITARTGDIPEDTAAFAIIHRPITAIELIDVLIWACEFKRLVEKNPTRARLIDHPRVDVFLEETATELLPTARWLSAIFEHLPLGLILLNPDGTVMRANRPILEKMGISGIGPGNRFEDIAPWKEIGGGKPLFQQCLAENKVLRDVFETEGGELCRCDSCAGYLGRLYYGCFADTRGRFGRNRVHKPVDGHLGCYRRGNSDYRPGLSLCLGEQKDTRLVWNSGRLSKQCLPFCAW